MKKVLLVEDDTDDQEFITQAFENVAGQVRLQIISAGAEVLPYLHNLADAELPEVILLDCVLPDMPVVEILTELMGHARYREIPKIVWSTSNAAHDRRRCLNAGALSFIVKPSDFKSIELVAQQVLYSATPAAENFFKSS